MRGLLMALLAFDFPGHNANHWAGRVGASPRSSKTIGQKTDHQNGVIPLA